MKSEREIDWLTTPEPKRRRKAETAAFRESLSLDKMSLANPGWLPSREQRCASDRCLLYDWSRVWCRSQL